MLDPPAGGSVVLPPAATPPPQVETADKPLAQKGVAPPPAVRPKETEGVLEIDGLRPAPVKLSLLVQVAIRGFLAVLFALLLSAIVLWAFVRVGNDQAWANTKELLNIVLPPVAGLLGTALGYYFGTHGKSAGGPDGTDSE